MSDLIQSLFTHGFMQNAFLACLLASIGCGIMGSYVVVKRMGFLTGGIAHTVLAGMGAAYFFGHAPLVGALVAALLAAIMIGLIKLRWQQDEDILIATFWSIGMAIGIIFISKTPGYTVDLMSYLFGNILLVTSRDLWLMLVLDGLLISMVFVFYKHLLIIAFDEEFALLRGVPVGFFYVLMLCMVAVSIVLMIQMVGLILVMALLILPAASASLFVRSFLALMCLAIIISLFTTTAGLLVSYQPDLPSGATIVIIAGVVYVCSILIHRFRLRSRVERYSQLNQ